MLKQMTAIEKAMFLDAFKICDAVVKGKADRRYGKVLRTKPHVLGKKLWSRGYQSHYFYFGDYKVEVKSSKHHKNLALYLVKPSGEHLLFFTGGQGQYGKREKTCNYHSIAGISAFDAFRELEKILSILRPVVC